MKFLHISDLHLGKRIHEFPMMEEQKNALEQVLPPWVTYKISASVKAIPVDYEVLPSEFKVIETPTCKFTKPRAKKEE